MPNTLIDKLHTQLTPEARHLFDAVVEHAARQNLRAFLVGGTVRDLLLGWYFFDIDVAIEGDAVRLAREMADATGAKLKTSQFGTARITVPLEPNDQTKFGRPSAFHVDLITARAETYTRPGTLPKVTPSTIDDDLRRRDFTVHAMAIDLQGGTLLDPCGGKDDLDAGLIRVLHDASFQDDATRILRAVRYAARFDSYDAHVDFEIEPHTLDLLRRDLSYVDNISGARLRREIERTFSEEHPDRVLDRLQELGVLAAIHQALGRDIDVGSPELRSGGNGDPNTPWCVLAFNATEEEAAEIARRLSFNRKQTEAVLAVPRLRAAAASLSPDARSSEIARLLAAFPKATIDAVASESPRPLKDRLLGFLGRTQKTIPLLRGEDLIALGITRGPDVASVLAGLSAARLDGEVTTREDEVQFVEAYLARELAGF